ncbi:MAG: flagellar export chaperone FlgN [Bdellovibrionales bacterium]|nr:flagellar export chaperone FlgN [Bdellovibrionales bacterium]
MSDQKTQLKALLAELHQALHALVGSYRQLLEIVRVERTALLDADLTAVQGATHAKEAQIEIIRQAELKRVQLVQELAMVWRFAIKDLTLNKIILEAQAVDAALSETLRTDLTTLTLLMERTAEQNTKNKEICIRSLKHIGEMKKNVLGEAEPKNETYSKKAQKVNSTGGGRLISGEA